MKKQRLFTYVSLFFLAFLLLVGCFNPASNIKTTQEQSAPTTPRDSSAVKLGFSAWPGWFPWQVAADKGIFDKHNVAVDLKWFDGYLESINTLTAEQIDANSQTLGDTVSSVAAGADQVVVLVNDNSTGNDKVIVRDGIKSVADLKGKKVAAEEGTVDHFLLLLGLQKAGLKPSDIEFVPLETGKAAAAFVAGQVDAVAVFAPFTTQALKRAQSRELFSSKDFPGAISDHLVFTRAFVEKNPEQVQAIVNSWFATLDYIQANQEEAYKIMAQRAGVTVEEYKEYADGTRLFTIEDNLTAFQKGDTMQSLDFSAKKMAEFLVNVGLAKTKADTSNILDDRFIKAYAEQRKAAGGN
jgi:NitT/TauT family transport system substrate-binding protein